MPENTVRLFKNLFLLYILIFSVSDEDKSAREYGKNFYHI